MTPGNEEKRYVGRTDEGLSPNGRKQLEEYKEKGVYDGILPLQAPVYWASPMKRCIETAHIIFPDAKPDIAEDLRETDFGRFEYRNYIEMSGDPEYQAWIDSGGTLPFPEGESVSGFRQRCCRAFAEIVKKELANSAERKKEKHSEYADDAESENYTENADACESENDAKRDLVFIVHGGTIMSVMAEFAGDGGCIATENRGGCVPPAAGNSSTCSAEQKDGSDVSVGGNPAAENGLVDTYYNWQVSNGCGYMCEFDPVSFRLYNAVKLGL